MNRDLATRAATQGGLILTADALAAGYNYRAISRELATKRWHHVRRGAYVPMEHWQQASETQRHLLLARAVQMQAASPLPLTHTTGCAALGIDLFRPDLRRVQVTHLVSARSRVEYDVSHHDGPLDLDECVRIDGMLIGPPVRVVGGAILVSNAEQAIVLGDAALRTGHATVEGLEALAVEWMRVPQSRSLRWAIPRLDGRAATVGESLGRVEMRRRLLPRPELQFEIRDGSFVAYTDFGWPEFGVVGEFDGKGKYLRDLRPGDDPGEVVFREKVREDRIRALGWTVVRFTWADLFAFDPIAARIGRALNGTPALAVGRGATSAHY